MTDAVYGSPLPPGAQIYRSTSTYARRTVIRSVLILTLAFVVLVVPMLWGVATMIGNGEDLRLIAVLPPLLALAVLGFAAVFTVYVWHVNRNSVLILTPAEVIILSPLAEVRTPWSNIERIGAAQIQTGNRRTDVVLARENTGRLAFILREPVRRTPLTCGLLGATLGRWVLAQSRGLEQLPYIVFTSFANPPADAGLWRDIQHYAPHLISHV